ncbi:MAG: hypothetical protein ACR2RL_19645, partial [Gammaproteobacteria bacterium]
MGATRLATAALILWSGVVAAAPLEREDVPPPLAPWVDWALDGHATRTCPRAFEQLGEHICAWPDALNLVVTARGGTFFQSWEVLAESFVALPGEPRHWPQAIEVDAEPAVVFEREGGPAVRLGPGSHTVSGRFVWARQPESLKLPDTTAMLALTLRGASVDFPDLDRDGRVWFSRSSAVDPAAAEQGDRLDIQAFRLVTDGIPLTLESHLVLNAAGESREVQV